MFVVCDLYFVVYRKSMNLRNFSFNIVGVILFLDFIELCYIHKTIYFMF